MKKKVLFIVAWYPNVDNGINGGFFRERALVLSNNFDFQVLLVNQILTNPIKIWKIIGGFKHQLRIKEDYLIEPPSALSTYCYGLKDSYLLNLLPYFIYKRIKKINHHWLAKTYRRSMVHLIKRGFTPDLIYAASIQTCGAFAYDLSKKFKVPYVLSEHSAFSSASLNRINTKEAVENADAIISISRDKTRQLLFCNLVCNPIYVGNLIDESRFPLKPLSIRTIKNILIVASYAWMKDYQTFFKTIQFLKKDFNKELKATVVGIGSNELIQKDFRNQLKMYGIEDVVDVYPVVDRTDIMRYYHDADIFLLTSIAEGMPNSALEAMACGLPVFATRCGGVEDIIDNKSGIIFNLKDFKSIALSIKSFLSGEIVYDPVYIRQRVIQHYGRSAYIEKVSSIFNNCMDRRALN